MSAIQPLHPGHHIAEFLKDVQFVVEANSFEIMCLWRAWKDRLTWRDDSAGYGHTLGHIGDRPIVVSLHIAYLNGHKVLFTNLTSQLADYAMLDEWLNVNCNPRYDDGHRRARTDANNFHLCAHEVLARKVVPLPAALPA